MLFNEKNILVKIFVFLIIMNVCIIYIINCDDGNGNSSENVKTPTPTLTPTPTSTPSTLQPPILWEPEDSSTLMVFNPEFVVKNSPSSDGNIQLWYEFRVAYDYQMTRIVDPYPGYKDVMEGNNGYTTWHWESGLFDESTYYWSSRCYDGDRYSDWAEPSRFSMEVCTNLFNSMKFIPPGTIDPYADAVINADINEKDNCFTDTTEALGAPDSSHMGHDESTYSGFVSLGFGGGITLDMGENEPIKNGVGVDFKVHQFISSEYIEVWVSNDGMNWLDLGIRSIPYEFDLDWAHVSEARYVMIYDRGETRIPDYDAHTPGAEIDAVEAYYY